MAPPLLFDISGVDLTRVIHDTAAIEAVNPHRGPMRLLDGIIYQSADKVDTLAYHDVRPDEFWVDGHIPGRPLMPGVLMVETAAQLASFVTLTISPGIQFMGFVGIDDVKFRGQVVPGQRLLILCKAQKVTRRRSICATQGVVDDNLVFEATITGMPI